MRHDDEGQGSRGGYDGVNEKAMAEKTERD